MIDVTVSNSEYSYEISLQQRYIAFDWELESNIADESIFPHVICLNFLHYSMRTRVGFRNLNARKLSEIRARPIEFSVTICNEFLKLVGISARFWNHPIISGHDFRSSDVTEFQKPGAKD